jgi:hypothetical protein
VSVAVVAVVFFLGRPFRTAVSVVLNYRHAGNDRYPIRHLRKLVNWADDYANWLCQPPIQRPHNHLETAMQEPNKAAAPVNYAVDLAARRVDGRSRLR